MNERHENFNAEKAAAIKKIRHDLRRHKKSLAELLKEFPEINDLTSDAGTSPAVYYAYAKMTVLRANIRTLEQEFEELQGKIK